MNPRNLILIFATVVAGCSSDVTPGEPSAGGGTAGTGGAAHGGSSSAGSAGTAGAKCSRNEWTASAVLSAPGHGPELAVDGDPNTYWDSDGEQIELSVTVPGRVLTGISFTTDRPPLDAYLVNSGEVVLSNLNCNAGRCRFSFVERKVTSLTIVPRGTWTGGWQVSELEGTCR